ncbi:leucine-rich repeat-containing protein (LRR) [Tieghemostelium lacteum]|uniref:non-specific serine/threonine protein kinase n=1 Tax=Tieghemostelium lacteum TaxID=361077 RepID=A0A152A0H4_TIELA|nr:leucine-rich repeat-containing protein (LRR) [Tieghemostelium lacteum]|eukprot:KYQ99761.1 leucine-rich repeat-containing protein (LRR) [Tieghemostelium lacteum]
MEGTYNYLSKPSTTTTNNNNNNNNNINTSSNNNNSSNIIENNSITHLQQKQSVTTLSNGNKKKTNGITSTEEDEEEDGIQYNSKENTSTGNTDPMLTDTKSSINNMKNTIDNNNNNNNFDKKRKKMGDPNEEERFEEEEEEDEGQKLYHRRKRTSFTKLSSPPREFTVINNNNNSNNNLLDISSSSININNKNNNNQQQSDEIEEITRERLERDKMLHEEVDDQYQNYIKYGDGEEGETYETITSHIHHHDDKSMNNNGSGGGSHKTTDESEVSHNNSPETHHFEDHQSTDEDQSKSDGEKEEMHSHPNSSEDRHKLMDIDQKDESNVSTPFQQADDEEDDEEDDVPLRIQSCLTNKSPKLSLSNSWLKVIPSDVWSLVELRDLDLSANHLKKVSKSIGLLVHLKRLRLNHNQLTILPKELYQLPRLTTLYLNNNNIKTMPKEINKLTSLKILDLSFNQITDISPQTNINQMSNLVELRLRYNQLSSLPANMLEASQLQVLWLEGNRLPLSKAILKKSPQEILQFLKDYKPPPTKARHEKPHVNKSGQNHSPPSIDTASTIAVAQVFAQNAMDTKKRKNKNFDDIKKQHIEAEMKLKQLEEELQIANAKASKFEEEATILQQQLHQPGTIANLPQILLSQQPHLWDPNSGTSPPTITTTITTPPTTTSPQLTSQLQPNTISTNVANGISQISLLSPTHNPSSPVQILNTNTVFHTQNHPPPSHILQQQQQLPLPSPTQQLNITVNNNNNNAIQSPQPTTPTNAQNQAIEQSPFAIPQRAKEVPKDKPFEWEVPLSDITLGVRIGRGGYGQVFRGNWRGTEVAVKMLFNDNVNPKLISDLRKEVDLLCKLRHPNIVLFMGACTEPESPCIVTEYLSKGSLANILLDENVKMDWGLRLQIGFDCARGMTYLHSRNPIIIHRDLKTDNLLVDDNWQVKVADFGLATVKSNTFAKTMCGTTGWVAPEVLAEEGYTEKADVYSFAIVLWELLTRLIPYAGKNTMQVVRSIDRGERLPIPDWCPKDYAQLINRCWETDPSHRPNFPQILIIMEQMITNFQTEKKDALAQGTPIPYVGPPLTGQVQNLQQTIIYQHQTPAVINPAPQVQPLQQQQQQQLQTVPQLVPQIIPQQQPQPQPLPQQQQQQQQQEQNNNIYQHQPIP